ncbi:hypothetical protein MAM1_0115d05692 [Mucor ambiguus]|uniref:CAP-Gly domain-containing protein n=1 Tax=Mucor ambiguus TaxID=91626 RepID=A0A0C9MSC6_9FUNG|nr:hypothetical protein MAM1_0115d05692 [Mucor ambiguus]
MRKQSFGQESNHNVMLALAPAEKHLYSNSDSGTSDSLNSSSSCSSNVPEKTHWACHKDVLKSTSHYFDAVFNSQFQEAEASIVFLPRGIFTSTVLDDVLYYMYTKSIKESGDRNMDKLEQLESVYLAADYLGIDGLCSTVKDHIIQLTHGLVCYCNSCTELVPQLLSFTGSHQENDPHLNQITHAILRLLDQDPEKTLPSYWSSDSMATLFAETESLHDYLESRLFNHVNRNNAIETLHGCFLAKNQIADKNADLRCTIEKTQKMGSKLLADHFDFYCTKYPKLLSCVDGITYSFEFLDYLMSCILEEMNDMNACSLYKGIVKSLMCRDIVQRTPLVKDILQAAKSKTIRYIAKHLAEMKQLDTIDKNVIGQLAQDLVVPVNTLLVQNQKPGNYTTTKSPPPPTPPLLVSSKHQKGASWNMKFRSRLCTMVFGQAALHFKVGQRVQLLNKPVLTMGTILYVGKVENRPGHFLGVELDRSVGSNDGSIDGKRYFSTLTNRGIFVKQSEVALL